jgi:predicted Zn finger-like uncharacterized protein
MRLVCPKCSAQYEVGADAIPDAGRDVQCSDCGHCWFQRRADAPLQKTLVAQLPLQPERAAVAASSAAADDAAPRPALPRRPLDENVMAILRAEALREAVARREEAARKSGLATPTVPAAGGPARAAAEAAPVRPPEPPSQASPAAPLAAARRAALPDIEEINATLTSGRQHRGADPASPPEDPRRGFRSGFGIMTLLAGLAAAAYVLAPRIAATVPETSGAMTAYVGTVDHLRRQLDATVATAQRQVESLLLSVE